MSSLNMENVKTINSVGFNMEKTNELIEDLKASGAIVGIEDLAGYLRKQGLIVKEHIGRKRNYVEVSPKLFGVDVSQKGDDVKELFKQHLKMGKMTFIPDSYEKLLVNLESSIRMARRRLCIGYEDSFMTIETFRQFSKDFEAKKEEYFKIRDEIVEKWDVLLRRFKQILYTSLDELNTLDKDTVFTSIVSRLPSKAEYENSFYMDLQVKAFPVTENLDMFDEKIKKQIQDGMNQDTINTLYEVIGSTLNDAFETITKILVSVEKNDKIANKTIGSLHNAAERISQKNIFHNPKINAIRNEVLEVAKCCNNIAIVSEKSEYLLGNIYGYAKDLGVDKMISLGDCPLSADELLTIYEMLQTVAASEEGEQMELFAI